MISFGHIIAQAGYDVKEFPKLTDIPVELYDRKNRELTEEREFEFQKKLFIRNLYSQKRFRETLEMLTKCPALPDKIYGKLDDTAFVLRIPGLTPKIFLLFEA